MCVLSCFDLDRSARHSSELARSGEGQSIPIYKSYVSYRIFAGGQLMEIDELARELSDVCMY